MEGKKTSSSLSGKNDSKGEKATFAQEAEGKPGRSAGSSKSKSSLRDVSTLKGLVKGVGFDYLYINKKCLCSTSQCSTTRGL